MKRIPIALLILALACASARAADVDDALAGLQSYWGTIETFTARFVQVKRLALFSGEMTSRGTFAFKKPDTMVFRYDPPEDTVIGIKPSLGLITYYYPGLKKAQRIHFSPGADASLWMSFGLGPIGDVTALKNSATVTVAGVNGLTVLTFAPKDTKGAILEVAVSMKKDYTPHRIRISEKNGDFTVIELSEQRVNPPVSGALFDVKIPAGVVVEDIGK